MLRTYVTILSVCLWGTDICCVPAADAETSGPTRIYHNRLTVLEDPPPLLADYPHYVQPIVESRRFEGPLLVDDPGANLQVRAWRFSYNARGIIEMPNRLRADQTAVIMVHPWGIDDGQGWRTPEPAGVADFCTPEKNHLAGRHTRDVIDPFLQRLRPHVGFIMYSMRAGEHPVHQKIYRSVRHNPSPQVRQAGRVELEAILNGFDYQGRPLPTEIELSSAQPVIDYFRQFPGLAPGDDYNNKGFWNLPTPVCSQVTMHDNDIVIYDADGYDVLRDFLKKHQIRHVLLTGYATDMCFCSTTAGYQNLSKDFNVFLVGDATLATFPANATPQYATNAHISYASLNQLVTQVSWVKITE